MEIKIGIRNPVGRHPSSSICSSSSRVQCSSVLGLLADGTDRRNRELKRVDRELSKGNEKTALKLVKRLQGKPDGLRGFGLAAKQIAAPQSLDLLDVDDGTVDSVLKLVMKIIRLALEKKTIPEMMVMDNQLLLSWETRHFMCAQHEAGHFLVAYLLGVLPGRYLVPTLTSIKEAMEDEQSPTNAFVELVDFDSPFEGNNSNVISKNLNKFCCIALGGILATYPDDVDQGFHSDIFKVYSSVAWLGFTDTETETYMRWVIQNTYKILKSHQVAALKLASAMANARPVWYCIAVIEDHLTYPI